MSSNEPDGKTTGSPSAPTTVGQAVDAAESAPKTAGDVAAAAAAATAMEARPQGAQRSTGPGGVPPWQRVGANGPQPGQRPAPAQRPEPAQQKGSGLDRRPAAAGRPDSAAPNPQPAPPPQAPAQPAQPQPAPSPAAMQAPSISPQSKPAAATQPQQPPKQAPAPQQGGSDRPTPQPAKRPVVTGTAAPAGLREPAAAATEAMPKSDPARKNKSGKGIDAPTRKIDRADAPSEDLPDLDAIHHPKPEAAAVRSVEAVRATNRGPLRASVQVRRIDPWSTLKLSGVVAVVGFFIWMIAIGILYLVLDGMGVWDSLNNSFGSLTSSDTTTTDSYEITAGAVFGIAALVGAINAVLLTALATVGAMIYNLCADLIGGVEVTLADRD